LKEKGEREKFVNKIVAESERYNKKEESAT